MPNPYFSICYFSKFNFQIVNSSKIWSKGRVPGIAEVFLHIVENPWLGILHLHNCGTIDDDFIPIFVIFFGLLDCDIIFLSIRKFDMFSIVSVPRYITPDIKIRSINPNCRNPTTIARIPSGCKVDYTLPASIRLFDYDPEGNAVNLLPSRIGLF